MSIKIQKRESGLGTRYTAQHLAPDGKWISVGTFGDRKIATKMARRAETDAEKASWVDPRKGRVTLKQFYENVYKPTVRTRCAWADLAVL